MHLIITKKKASYEIKIYKTYEINKHFERFANKINNKIFIETKLKKIANF